MTMKKNTLIIALLAFSLLSLFSTRVYAKDSLIGNWASSKIQLHLKPNHRYIYSVKILGIKKKFKGSWSTKTISRKNGKKANLLILNYTLLGKHSKTAEYSFSKGRLKLKQNGKVQYLTKK